MTATEGTGDGDGDPTGDGDGDPTGDGDGDPTGDGDGDPAGDGDGDPAGDGDGDPTGDGDGDPTGDGDGEPAVCGDGNVDPGEDCDDGNMQANDGCENDCSISEGLAKLTPGSEHTCALFWTGEVKCWGNNDDGQLGYGFTNTIGDDEPANTVNFVNIGGSAIDIAAGDAHTCAVLDDGAVVCWGANDEGQLGYGNTTVIGNNEFPDSAGPVDVGDDVVKLAIGYRHTCALTDQQTVRCWGMNHLGQLGLGHTETIGDDELPSSVAPVSLGDDAIDLAAGTHSACALLAGGGLRCWGSNIGQFGAGHTETVGDNELPSSYPFISIGDLAVVELAMGPRHTCVLYEDQTLRCWGDGDLGRLGYASTETIGDDEGALAAPLVNVGAAVDEISLSASNTCVRMGTNVKCWGYGNFGTNGYGNMSDLGDGEVPGSYGNVDVGFDVTGLIGDGRGFHTCALSGSDVRCWGRNNRGQLGYGNTDAIGDDELPSSVGVVPYL